MYKAYLLEKSGVAPADEKIEPWLDVLNRVADLELWNESTRSERPEWREWLKKADDLEKVQRKPISKVCGKRFC